uniref:Protein kinase putative n=1 Tax=Albugo laibachii Nc14 TaxID=890382 RepID=F0W531_9STRA|nr:protein kinase putative [Albugo laibachii Nc14]|eukprot:CCA16222.1 protein kinase putative [Albugo laibachii Nc14]
MSFDPKQSNNSDFVINKLEFYVIQRRLAHSIFGDVFLCKHELTNQLIAVKRVSLKCAAEHTALQTHTFVQENVEFEVGIHRDLATKAKYQNKNENILQMLDEIQYDNYLYMIFDYCEQGELFGIVDKAQDGRLSALDVVHYFKQIVQGVDFLHENGYAHRDLSLENVLVTSEGICKLCDFGLASYARASCCESVGKPSYMAPEVLEGIYYDPIKADIWSLGIILFILVAGTPPFECPHPSDPRFKALSSHGTEILLRKWKLHDQVSSSAIQLMDGMLQVDPKRRITIEQILNHPFFNATRNECSSKVSSFEAALSCPLSLGGKDNYLAISLQAALHARSRS